MFDELLKSRTFIFAKVLNTEMFYQLQASKALLDDRVGKARHPLKVFRLSVDVLEGDGLVPAREHVGVQVAPLRDAGQVPDLRHRHLLHLDLERSVESLDHAQLLHVRHVPVHGKVALRQLQRVARRQRLGLFVQASVQPVLHRVLWL